MKICLTADRLEVKEVYFLRLFTNNGTIERSFERYVGADSGENMH